MVFLVTDVELVKRQKGCKVLKACEFLAEGYLPHKLTVLLPDGTRKKVRAASENWKGRNPSTLHTRYYECLSDWVRMHPPPEDEAEVK